MPLGDHLGATAVLLFACASPHAQPVQEQSVSPSHEDRLPMVCYNDGNFGSWSYAVVALQRWLVRTCDVVLWSRPRTK